MKIINDLKNSQCLNNITNSEKIKKNFNDLNSSIYCGFDPTAKSLHLGNYIQIIFLNKIIKLTKIKPIVVIGGATGIIGDPSGKISERTMLDSKIIFENSINIEKQLKKYIPNVLVLNNYDWHKKISFINFLKKYGKFFNVNSLINKDTIKRRLLTGISYTEFSYSLMQAIDFYYLYKKYNCYVQIGGSDQWGNIVTGIDYIQKKIGSRNKATGITFNLLENSDGKKFGKSEKGALFLDINITSSYAFYQFFYNQNDNDLKKLFNFLTYLSSKKITNIINEHEKKRQLRLGQKTLAKYVISDLFGIDKYKSSEKISNFIFSNQITKLDIYKINEIIQVIGIKKIIKYNDFYLTLIKINLFRSKREINEFINDKALIINDIIISKELIKDFYFTKINAIYNKYFFIKKGKKNFFCLTL